MVFSSRPRTPSNGNISTSTPGANNVPPLPGKKSFSSNQDNKIGSQDAAHAQPAEKPRRSSLGLLLRRSKSTELNPKSKKAQALLREQELARQQEEMRNTPPKLPDLYNGSTPPKLQTFGGETDDSPRPSSLAIISGMTSPKDTSQAQRVNGPPKPRYGIYNGLTNNFGGYVDPYARTQSMTHRGRPSYASSAISTINSPRRVRRRKDPTPFNVLIIGSKNSGKTSFLNFLKTTFATPAYKRAGGRPADDVSGNSNHHHHEAHGINGLPSAAASSSSDFTPHYIETDLGKERVGLTLWDSPGLEKTIADLQLREMAQFVESKFEDTLAEEMKVVRDPGIQDTHIHCAFLVLDPLRLDANLDAAQKLSGLLSKNNGANDANGTATATATKATMSKIGERVRRVRGCLDEDFELQAFRLLQGKTTVIPVVAKADTVTRAHMARLKRGVWRGMREAGVDPLEPLGLDGAGSEAGAEGRHGGGGGGGGGNSKRDSPGRIDEEDEDDDEEDDDDDDDNDDDGEESSGRAATESSDGGADGVGTRGAAKSKKKRNHNNGKADKSHVNHNNNNNNTSNGYHNHEDGGDDDDDDEALLLGRHLPFSLISPDMHDNDGGGGGSGALVRQFPWGTADPANPEHCDFERLKSDVFLHWRAELRGVSSECWYEDWRRARLTTRSSAPEGAQREKEREAGAGMAKGGGGGGAARGGRSGVAKRA